MNIDQITLSQLPIGKKANVWALMNECEARARLLDLGVIDGTEIESLYKSPSGSPVAYLIRGAVIALRSDISEKIIVSLG
mgnify:CR=1 FL=1